MADSSTEATRQVQSKFGKSVCSKVKSAKNDDNMSKGHISQAEGSSHWPTVGQLESKELTDNPLTRKPQITNINKLKF